MEGPIARYSDVADTLYTGKPLEYRNVVDGYVRIFWGLFKKMVIADRMALMVNQVFDHYAAYHGAVILAAAIGYVIQLYMEFSGCMDIIIGSGKLFGICLPENFRQPFCAKTPSEFWRRWHIHSARGSRHIFSIRYRYPDWLRNGTSMEESIAESILQDW